MMKLKVTAAEIAKLQAVPGDIVVLKTPLRLAAGAAEQTHQQLAGLLPRGVRVLILDCGTDISVLTKSEIEKRASLPRRRLVRSPRDRSNFLSGGNYDEFRGAIRGGHICIMKGNTV